MIREVPVWAADRPSAAAVERPAPSGTAAPGGARTTLRPRSGFVVALLVFFLLQSANSAVLWREAPIRTDPMVDAIVAHLACALLAIAALLLRGRWRVVPVLAATLVGAAVPVYLNRDLMDVVGPRNVWVGQSLTLQVLFPLVVGLVAAIAVITAPRVATPAPAVDRDPAPPT